MPLPYFKPLEHFPYSIWVSSLPLVSIILLPPFLWPQIHTLCRQGPFNQLRVKPILMYLSESINLLFYHHFCYQLEWTHKWDNPTVGNTSPTIIAGFDFSKNPGQPPSLQMLSWLALHHAIYPQDWVLTQTRAHHHQALQICSALVRGPQGAQIALRPTFWPGMLADSLQPKWAYSLIWGHPGLSQCTRLGRPSIQTYLMLTELETLGMSGFSWGSQECGELPWDLHLDPGMPSSQAENLTVMEGHPGIHPKAKRLTSFSLSLPLFQTGNNQSTHQQVSLRCILNKWELFGPQTVR